MIEYCTLAFQQISGQALQDKLTELGKEEWEMCAAPVLPTEAGVVMLFIFKRQARLVQKAVVLG